MATCSCTDRLGVFTYHLVQKICVFIVQRRRVHIATEQHQFRRITARTKYRMGLS